jgi:hypothetical protein
MIGTPWRFMAIAANALLLLGNIATAETVADEDLLTLAHERFTNISSDKERKAFETFFKNTQRGERVDLTPELDAHNDVWPLINPAFAIVSERDRIIEADILTNPVYADIWEKDRVILADWINWLCTDPKASERRLKGE